MFHDSARAEPVLPTVPQTIRPPVENPAARENQCSLSDVSPTDPDSRSTTDVPGPITAIFPSGEIAADVGSPFTDTARRSRHSGQAHTYTVFPCAVSSVFPSGVKSSNRPFAARAFGSPPGSG